jgi:hypothetical protein
VRLSQRKNGKVVHAMTLQKGQFTSYCRTHLHSAGHAVMQYDLQGLMRALVVVAEVPSQTSGQFPASCRCQFRILRPVQTP